ncbi:5'/3'-nucleotidase SurE [Cohaesibacter haloalkalitolerans]|uniref:5'/3'-nucleotidase SurE n=1 Tax=Cohaesibacter haloalkalitolerans TaxID=1162980 RepID=UPI000E65D472|nr:5'/3'-nucleotidase SurE [Cohaesibacter haloalkalitolerans]
MRILLTNDDGINAPGLQVLEKIAHALSDDVWVVAPETEQSGMAHSLTLHDPLRMRKLGEKRYAVHGTPTDCVIMGVDHILDGRPDLVLSGVNRGQNMAEDVTYSGTVAGAMEGVLLGIRSIALSQSYSWESCDPFDWSAAEEHGARVVKDLLEHSLPRQTLLNVNFPACPADEVEEVVYTRQGKRDQAHLSVVPRVDTRGMSYFWLGFEDRRSNPDEGTDLHAVMHKKISVTPLHLDMTDNTTLAVLKKG